MGKFTNYTGKQFNSWTVLKRLPNRHGNKTYWLCRCKCGKEKEVQGTTLVHGRSKKCSSCNVSNVHTTHGYTKDYKKHPMYLVWRAIKDRCLNPNNKNYHNYGARGIKICDRWENSFVNFFNDVGEKPFKGASLDRIDNDGNYEPHNIRWATHEQQVGNTRRQKYGVCVKKWSREHNKDRFHVARWLREGKSLEEIKKLVTKPFQEH